MNLKNKKCLFTGYSSSNRNDLELNEVIIESSTLGFYRLSEDAYDVLTNYGENSIVVSQGGINCAKRCLELKEQNKRVIPIWISREQSTPYLQAIAERNNKSYRSLLVPCILEDVMSEPVDHSQKPIQLLQNFGEKVSHSKAFARFRIEARDHIRAGIVDNEEFVVHIDYLLKNKWLATTDDHSFGQFANNVSDSGYLNNNEVYFVFTIKGWEQLRSQVASDISSRKVFIATAFSWIKDEDVRLQAIQAIKDVCKELGYEADTVSQGHTENISNRIMAEIRQSKFVIAELTYHNRGVYFESGFARGIGKNVFHIVRKGFTSHDPKDDMNATRIHFDVAQIQYREWYAPEDLKIKLKDWIEATLGKFRG